VGVFFIFTSIFSFPGPDRSSTRVKICYQTECFGGDDRPASKPIAYTSEIKGKICAHISSAFSKRQPSWVIGQEEPASLKKIPSPRGITSTDVNPVGRRNLWFKTVIRFFARPSSCEIERITLPGILRLFGGKYNWCIHVFISRAFSLLLPDRNIPLSLEHLLKLQLRSIYIQSLYRYYRHF